VPYLAHQIYTHNNDSKTPEDQKYNLGGIMVGNGATDFHYDVWPSFADVVWGKQIIPTSLYNNLKKDKCVQYFHGVFSGNTDTGDCKTYWDEMMALTADLNWYDLYREKYGQGLSAPPTMEERTRTVEIGGELKTYKVGYTPNEYTPWLKEAMGTNGDNTLSDYVSLYLNKPEVRKALNIPDSVQAWSTCSGDLEYTVGTKGSIWIYPELRHNIDILFFSGDTDGAVPGWGTRQWIHNDLKWDVLSSTKAWFVDNQFEGEITRYDGIDFATIHGVGHMAPQWKRL
jgi:cathepsin A (carboxypeptidase C)